MTLDSSRRRTRLVALNVYVWILVALGAVLVAIPVVDRPLALYLARPYTPIHEPQETPLDLVQEPPYAAALVICIVMQVRLRHRPDRLPYWVLLGVVTAFLLWRELPYSERILGATTFSWRKYMGGHEAPLWGRIVLGGGSMAVTAALAVYVLWKWRGIVQAIRERFFAMSTALIVAAGLALVGAQMLDKHRSTDSVLGTAITAWNLKDYTEESLEFVGPVLLLMGTVMALLEEPRGEASS